MIKKRNKRVLAAYTGGPVDYSLTPEQRNMQYMQSLLTGTYKNPTQQLIDQNGPISQQISQFKQQADNNNAMNQMKVGIANSMSGGGEGGGFDLSGALGAAGSGLDTLIDLAPGSKSTATTSGQAAAQSVMDVAKGGMKGAQIGMVAGGPLGAAIGAGVGMWAGAIGKRGESAEMTSFTDYDEGTLGTGLIGAFTNRRLKRERERIKKNALGNRQAVVGTANLQNEWNLNYGGINTNTFADGGTIPSSLVYVDDGELINTPDGSITKVAEQGKPKDSNLLDLPVGSRILSDTLKVPGSKDTFAKAGEKIMKKRNSQYNDKYAQNSQMLNDMNNQKAYDDLFDLQEQVKTKKGIKPKTKQLIPAAKDGLHTRVNSIPEVTIVGRKPIRGSIAEGIASGNSPLYIDDNGNMKSFATLNRIHTETMPQAIPEIVPVRVNVGSSTPSNLEVPAIQLPGNLPLMNVGLRQELNRFTWGHMFNAVASANAASANAEWNVDYPYADIKGNIRLRNGDFFSKPVGRVPYDLGYSGGLAGKNIKKFNTNGNEYYNPKEALYDFIHGDFKQPLNFRYDDKYRAGFYRSWDAMDIPEARITEDIPLEDNITTEVPMTSTVRTNTRTRSAAINKAPKPVQPIRRVRTDFALTPIQGLNYEATELPTRLEKIGDAVADKVNARRKQEEQRNQRVSDILDTISGIGELTPALMNLTEGRPHPINANYNPYADAILNTVARRRFDINPILSSIRRNRAMANYNANQLATNTGANLAANVANTVATNNAIAEAYTAKNNMDNQYLADYANQMNSLGQQWVNATNLAEDLNRRQYANTRNVRRQGAAQISQWLQNRRLMKNQEARDNALLSLYDPMLRSLYMNSDYSNWRNWIGQLNDFAD